MLDSSTAAFAFAGLFGLVGAAVAPRISPRLGLWLITTGGAVAGVAGAIVLLLLATPLVAQNSEVAEAGHWSVRALERHDPTNDGVAALALVLLVVLLLRTARLFVLRVAALRAAARACREAGSAAGDLVVVSGDGAEAYAVAGRPGRVVVSQRVLAALTVDQRRALFAHERAHLAQRHHFHLLSTELAVTLNPLLRPLRAAHAYCVERAADEAAAAATDRRTAAATLDVVAGMRGGPPTGSRVLLAAATDAVDRRAAALRDPAPGLHPTLTLASIAVVAAIVVATSHVFADTVLLLRLAHTATQSASSVHRTLVHPPAR